MIRATVSIASGRCGEAPLRAVGSLMSDMVLWFVVLGGVIVLGGLAVAVIRRMATGAAQPRGQDDLLRRLEQLRQQGAITEEEYRRARDSALGAAGQTPPAAPGPPSGADDESDSATGT